MQKNMIGKCTTIKTNLQKKLTNTIKDLDTILTYKNNFILQLNV